MFVLIKILITLRSKAVARLFKAFGDAGFSLIETVASEQEAICSLSGAGVTGD